MKSRSERSSGRVTRETAAQRGFALMLRPRLACAFLFVPVLAAQATRERSELSPAQMAEWRARIRTTFFAGPPLPSLAPQSHGRFEPGPGVVAERITYA